MSYYQFNDCTIEGYPKYERRNKFEPYSMNGGSVVAVAGDDYAIIGADTRLSVDFSIYSRAESKIVKLSETAVLGVTGCWGDAITLCRMLETRLEMYKRDHNKTMSTPAIAQMLSVILYYKRFFPYYVTNIIAGLDEDGEGCIFSYDPVGHCDRNTFTASGTAGHLLQPLLDNQIGKKNMKNVMATGFKRDKALSLIKDGFTSAAERDVYTGDTLEILTITAGGILKDTFPLRKD